MLYDPPDVDVAFQRWGANCGPCALAAALGLRVGDVREAVSDGAEFRGHMNVPGMRRALAKLGAAAAVVDARDVWSLRNQSILMILQWCGPWESHPRSAAAFRHWIVFHHGSIGSAGILTSWIYDVNAGWIERDDWEKRIVPRLIPERGTGEWLVSWAARITP